MKRLLPSLLLVVLLGALAAPAAAQEDLAQYILDAYERTAELSSFVYESESDQTVTLNMGGDAASAMDMDVNQTTTVQGVRDGDELNLSAVLTLPDVMGGGETTLEIIRVGGETFVRAPGVSGMMAQVFPEDWVNVTEDPDSYPGIASYGNEMVLNQLASPLGSFPLNPDVLGNVEELEGEELDGMQTRVFRFSPDLSQLDEEAMAELSEMMGGAAGAGSGGMDLSQMGIDMEEVMRDAMENAVIEVTVWIDEETGYVVQSVVDTDLTLNLDMQGMEIATQTAGTTTTRLVEYDTDITIEAPEVE